MISHLTQHLCGCDFPNVAILFFGSRYNTAMRAHQRQYTVAELFVLDKLSYLLDFRFAQIHRTVDENAMYLAIFGTFLNLIDIVIGVNYIDINSDGCSLKKIQFLLEPPTTCECSFRQKCMFCQ